MNTLFLFASAPWATILSTTYGTVEPSLRQLHHMESHSVKRNAPEPIPITYVSDLSPLAEGSEKNGETHGMVG